MESFVLAEDALLFFFLCRSFACNTNWQHCKKNTVVVQTARGDSITGIVLVFDPVSHILALESGRELTMFNTSAIAVTLVSKGDPSANRSLPPVDNHRLAARETKAIADRVLESAKLGKGVPLEAQRLFDALSKQFPAHWEGTVMVLANAMRLGAPYESSSLSGGSAQQQQRMQRMIDAERARMSL